MPYALTPAPLLTQSAAAVSAMSPQLLCAAAQEVSQYETGADNSCTKVHVKILSARFATNMYY
jgi:hypothetical protein